MEEYSAELGNESAVVERLEALNSILGGIRSSMMTNDERTENLAEKICQWEKSFFMAKGHEVQIEVLREQLAELALSVDKIISTSDRASQDKEIFSKFESLNFLLSDLRQVMENDHGALKAEDILPQLDELRAHQEALESRLNGVSHSATQVQWELLEARLNEQGSALGGAEVSLRGFEVDLVEQRNELNQLRASHETQEGEWRQRVDALENWKAESLDVDGRMDVRYQAMCDHLESIKLKVQEIENSGHAREADLLEAFAQIRIVVDGLAQSEVVGRARHGELNGISEELKTAIVALQSEMGERQQAVEELGAQVELMHVEVVSHHDSLHSAILENTSEIRQLQIGFARTEAELLQEQAQRAEGMSHELTLARDHMDDHQRKVVEDLEQLKKSHREMSSLREQLEEKNKETSDARREIRNLKEQLEDMGGTFTRHQRFQWVGMAAVFFLGLGATTLIMPNSMPMLPATAPMTTQNAPSSVMIPLDAPAVESLEEEPLVASTQNPQSTNGTESQTETVETPMSVVPAFTRQSSKGSAAMVDAANRKVEYTVKDGDSLWKIANKHPGEGNVTARIERIKKENQLKDGRIRRGQVLSISL